MRSILIRFNTARDLSRTAAIGGTKTTWRERGHCARSSWRSAVDAPSVHTTAFMCGDTTVTAALLLPIRMLRKAVFRRRFRLSAVAAIADTSNSKVVAFALCGLLTQTAGPCGGKEQRSCLILFIDTTTRTGLLEKRPEKISSSSQKSCEGFQKVPNPVEIFDCCWKTADWAGVERSPLRRSSSFCNKAQRVEKLSGVMSGVWCLVYGVSRNHFVREKIRRDWLTWSCASCGLCPLRRAGWAALRGSAPIRPRSAPPRGDAARASARLPCSALSTGRCAQPARAAQTACPAPANKCWNHQRKHRNFPACKPSEAILLSLSNCGCLLEFVISVSKFLGSDVHGLLLFLFFFVRER